MGEYWRRVTSNTCLKKIYVYRCALTVEKWTSVQEFKRAMV